MTFNHCAVTVHVLSLSKVTQPLSVLNNSWLAYCSPPFTNWWMVNVQHYCTLCSLRSVVPFSYAIWITLGEIHFTAVFCHGSTMCFPLRAQQVSRKQIHQTKQFQVLFAQTTVCWSSEGEFWGKTFWSLQHSIHPQVLTLSLNVITAAVCCTEILHHIKTE